MPYFDLRDYLDRLHAAVRAPFDAAQCDPAFRSVAGLSGPARRAHPEIDELEQYLRAMLSAAPPTPDPRWLAEFRALAAQYCALIEHYIADEERAAPTT